MAAQIRIARGNKANKSGGLLYGELFWEKTSSGELGTLYIGKPDGASGSDLAIGGARAMESLFYRGSLAGGTAFPVDAKVGDFWIMTADGTSALAEYKTGDWIVCIGIAQFTRVNNSGGQADEVSYVNAGTSLNATNVQDAITDLAKLKMQYAGTIASTAQVPAQPTVGGLYLITQSKTVTISADSSYVKGDWAFYDGTAWTHIPAGFTDAEDTGFDNTGVTRLNGTAVTQTNVQTALVDIFEHKADLDGSGKILVDQLPAAVLGSLQYQGTWDISVASPVLPTDTTVGHYYVVTGGQKTVGGVEYTDGDWIVRDSTGWEKVDNSDKLSGITVGASTLVGTPEIQGSDKVAVSAAGNVITVAGQNLVDYDSTLTAVETVVGTLPRIVDKAGKVGASSIVDTGSTVTIESDLTVGDANATGGAVRDTTFNGDVIINATGEVGSKGVHALKFVDTSGIGNAASIEAPAVLGGNPVITVPSATGTLIVKNSATTADKLAKFTADGVIANSAISDNGTTVTIEEPVVIGSAAVPENLTVNGLVQVVNVNSENAAKIAAPALTSDITVVLPSVSGTLATTDQLTQGVESAINGTAKTIAMFSGAHAVGNSIITQNAGDDTVTIAGKLKVGTAGVAQEFDVYGATKFFNAAGDQSVTFSAPTASSVQTLPDHDGVLLNDNSAIDGGVF
jgi:hypothetical protein